MAELAQADVESIEIGQWSRDGVFWLVEHGQSVLEPLSDFTSWVNRLLIGGDPNDGYLVALPWYAWPLVFALAGIVTLRPTRGVRAAALLVAIQSFGSPVAEEFSQSLAMTVVGVGLGIIGAIPVAIVAHFSPGLRRVIRRFADTGLLIVLTSLMLPLVFVFGLGTSTALWTIALFTLAPMTKAITNALGAVRTDRSQAIQEIAAGLNTSTVVGVILQSSLALIGAGGLGRLLFRATNNLNLDLHFVSAFAILALTAAFDQVTRPSGRDGVFFDRTHRAWNLPTSSDELVPIPPTYLRTAPPTIIGAAIALGSLALPWSSDRGTVTSHVREADLSIPGASFNGIDELGGSGFGIAIGTLAGCALLAVLLRAVRRNGPPADITTAIAIAIVTVSAAFLTTAAAPFAAPSGVSVGAIVALVGGVVMLLGTAIQSGGGPWIATNDSARLGYVATVLGLAVAGLCIVIGSAIGWVVDFDPPQQSLSLDIEAEIDRLTAEAGDDINKQIAAAQAIQDLINGQQIPDAPLRTGGLHIDGPHTAFTVLVASGLAVLSLVVSMITRIERLRWLAFGLAFGAALSSAAWIASTAIEHDPALQSDGGPFLALLGAAGLAAIARRAPRRVVRGVSPTAEPTPVAEPELPTTIEIPDLSPV